jgi:hypothetical protein
MNTEVTDLQAFRTQALSRLTAQHDEITALRQELQAAPNANVFMLPSR